jgi:hypothetical protein
MKTLSLEEELYAGRFDDGMLDLCVGVGLLGTGLLWLLDHVELVGAVPALLIPLWLGLRKRITEPRVGRVKFSKERRRAERHGLLSALGAGIGVLALVLAAVVWARGGGPNLHGLEGWNALVPLVPGLLVALGLVVVSVMIGARRFVAHAVALMALAALITWWGGDPGLYLALAGALLCLWSVTVVARFVATHPDLDEERGH